MENEVLRCRERLTFGSSNACSGLVASLAAIWGGSWISKLVELVLRRPSRWASSSAAPASDGPYPLNTQVAVPDDPYASREWSRRWMDARVRRKLAEMQGIDGASRKTQTGPDSPRNHIRVYGGCRCLAMTTQNEQSN